MESSEIMVTQQLKRLVATFIVLLVADAFLWPPTLRAGDKSAMALRTNVVRIKAEWQNGQTHDGFGFITGEKSGSLYIATANHIVRGQAAPDEVATSVMVTFFSQQGDEIPATLLGTNNTLNDLAVLRVDQSPQQIPWKQRALSSQEPIRDMQVWYVGRSGEWFVPTANGAINQIGSDNRIAIDGFDIRVGTSGAPLVTDDGIVGMLLSDENGLAYALTIESITRDFKKWNHPWQLNSMLEEGPRPRNNTTVGWIIIGKYSRGTFYDLSIHVPEGTPARGNKYRAKKNFRLVQKGPTEQRRGEAVITLGMVHTGEFVEVLDLYIPSGSNTQFVHAKVRAKLYPVPRRR